MVPFMILSGPTQITTNVTRSVIDALIARPARVVNLTAKATDYKTIQLNWDAVEGATYYQIYRLNTQTGKWI